jgi:hypothetical protein
MALFNELPEAERTELEQFLILFRASMGELSRTMSRFEILKAAYQGQIQPIVQLLDTDAVIPNTSGLRGAAAMTKAEMLALFADLNQLLTDYNTDAKKQARVKAAGARDLFSGP